MRLRRCVRDVARGAVGGSKLRAITDVCKGGIARDHALLDN